MEEILIGDSEFDLMEIIWEKAPVSSGELVSICDSRFGWKKSTVYTMLKRLGDKNIIKNESSIVDYIVDKKMVQKYQSESLVQKSFGGSLSLFVNSFLGDRCLSKNEAQKLIDMIEEHTEE
ncbi:MAG: BlaI/MecI/CopY family transcriptional regulator [Eubacterium sp.]|nr:BlaI/MecI/CopY family transcriptional regulator [Eubacterium sp.]